MIINNFKIRNKIYQIKGINSYLIKKTLDKLSPQSR